MHMDNEPRIYRACLACYNNADLVGKWFDATDTDAIEAWQEEHEASTGNPTHGPGHEEYATHDYDNMVNLGEYASLADIARVASMVEKHDLGPVKAFYEDRHEVTDDFESDFEDAFRGVWDSERDFTEDFVESLGLLADAPEDLKRYFDYEAYARDLFINDFWSSELSDYSVAVFYRN
jgi:antirestriction protein